MKKMPPASPETLSLYAEIGDDLKQAGATTGSLFGMPALKCEGKAFAGLFGDGMVFKLTGDAHQNAMKLKGSELFDPSGMKRPMKAWVVISKTHRKKWKEFARKALQAAGEG